MSAPVGDRGEVLLCQHQWVTDVRFCYTGANGRLGRDYVMSGPAGYRGCDNLPSRVSSFLLLLSFFRPGEGKERYFSNKILGFESCHNEIRYDLWDIGREKSNNRKNRVPKPQPQTPPHRKERKKANPDHKFHRSPTAQPSCPKHPNRAKTSFQATKNPVTTMRQAMGLPQISPQRNTTEKPKTPKQAAITQNLIHVHVNRRTENYSVATRSLRGPPTNNRDIANQNIRKLPRAVPDRRTMKRTGKIIAANSDRTLLKRSSVSRNKVTFRISNDATTAPTILFHRTINVNFHPVINRFNPINNSRKSGSTDRSEVETKKASNISITLEILIFKQLNMIEIANFISNASNNNIRIHRNIVKNGIIPSQPNVPKNKRRDERKASKYLEKIVKLGPFVAFEMAPLNSTKLVFNGKNNGVQDSRNVFFDGVVYFGVDVEERWVSSLEFKLEESMEVAGQVGMALARFGSALEHFQQVGTSNSGAGISGSWLEKQGPEVGWARGEVLEEGTVPRSEMPSKKNLAKSREKEASLIVHKKIQWLSLRSLYEGMEGEYPDDYCCFVSSNSLVFRCFAINLGLGLLANSSIPSGYLRTQVFPIKLVSEQVLGPVEG
ncbi:hypothetical protein M5K25_019268 [Dendrobium thyrsiflorum]|uniref:Uncharacterized protein n=1 Tax=Dendrobium thyrsiflorum TaxID=117978 RepID=A0ABD0ULF0_DENTH